MKRSPEGRPRYLADAPVAMTSASQVYVPLSPVRANGRLEKSTLLMWSNTICVLKRSVGCLQLHQFRALHAVYVGGPIVHLGRGHELAPLCDPGDQHWAEDWALAA